VLARRDPVRISFSVSLLVVKSEMSFNVASCKTENETFKLSSFGSWMHGWVTKRCGDGSYEIFGACAS
jgi:hypothetical protein